MNIMELQDGEVLVKAKIVERAKDTRPPKECGYLISVGRNEAKVYVEPNDMLFVKGIKDK